MIVYVPTSKTESWYEETVKLDGSKYVLRFMWSARARRWYLDIETEDGTVLRTGIKVVADRPLNLRMTDDLRPPGQLWSVDRTGFGIDPDLRDIGSRVFMWYAEEASIVG